MTKKWVVKVIQAAVVSKDSAGCPNGYLLGFQYIRKPSDTRLL